MSGGQRIAEGQTFLGKIAAASRERVRAAADPAPAPSLPRVGSRWQNRKHKRITRVTPGTKGSSVVHRYEAPVPDVGRCPSDERNGGHGPYVQTVTEPLEAFLRRFKPLVDDPTGRD